VASAREAAEALIPYVERETAAGVRANAILRHVVGLFHAVPGARAFRRYLSSATGTCVRVRLRLDVTRRSRTVSRRDQTERVAQHLGARRRADRCRGQVTAKRARTRHGVKQSHHVAQDGIRPHPRGSLALHIGDSGPRPLRAPTPPGPAHRTAPDRHR